MASNIAPNDNACYEDWYVHPKYIKPHILEIMTDDSDETKKATKYMLNQKKDTKKTLDTIDLGVNRPVFMSDKK